MRAVIIAATFQGGRGGRREGGEGGKKREKEVEKEKAEEEKRGQFTRHSPSAFACSRSVIEI